MRPTAPSLWPLLVVAGAAGVGVFEWLRPPAAAEGGAAPGDGMPAALARPAAEGGAAPGDGMPAALARPALACPADQLPDDGVCIPVPPPEDTAAEAPTAIELLPGRSADYTRYVTPIAAYPASPAPQGTGLYVSAPRGVPVTAISLEAQVGPTRRWVTPTSPPRLLTLHRVERGGATRTYVLAYAGLTFDASPGSTEVDVGTPLGRVAPASGITGLGLTARQVRRGVDAESVRPERLLLDSSSLACDPRNVLPLKPGADVPPVAP
jgi:hypothetical protein